MAIDPSMMQAGGPPGPPAMAAPPAGPGALEQPDPNMPPASPDQQIPMEGDPTDPQQFAAMLSAQVQEQLMGFAQMLDDDAKQKLAAAAQMAQEDMQSILSQVMDNAGLLAQTLDGPSAGGY